MAKGKSKQTSDNFMRNVVIVFGSIMVIMIVALIIANIFGPKTKYSDFDAVTNYALVDNQVEDVYGVYFYSETCGACNSIKARLIAFADSNEMDLKIYMMDAYGTSGDRSLITGPGGVGLTSTPTMLIFKDGLMVDFIVNADNITDFFDEVEAGSYTLD